MNSPHLVEQMIVLECDKHPREKLCAGGMLNDGDYILERLGLNCSEVPHVEVSEARFQEEFNQGFFDFSAIVEDVQGYVWRFPSIEGGKHFTTRGIYDARVIPRPRKNLNVCSPFGHPKGTKKMTP